MGGAVEVFVNYTVLTQAGAENLEQAGEPREHQRYLEINAPFCCMCRLLERLHLRYFRPLCAELCLVRLPHRSLGPGIPDPSKWCVRAWSVLEEVLSERAKRQLPERIWRA